MRFIRNEDETKKLEKLASTYAQERIFGLLEQAYYLGREDMWKEFQKQKEALDKLLSNPPAEQKKSYY